MEGSRGGHVLSDLRKGEAGFTVIDLLIVVVLLGILAAVALPRFAALTTAGRAAQVKSLASTVRMAADQVYGMCMASNIYSRCTVSSGSWSGTINGQPYQLSMGYPDAGDNLNNSEIDAYISYAGFTAQLTDWQTTTFVLTSAPTPANCSVAYVQANYFGSPVPVVTTTTSGC